MRSIFYFLLVIALIVAAYFLYNKCSEAYYDTDATVIVDRTENNFLAMPDMEEVKKLFPQEETPWKGYRFRIVTLSDVDFNPVFETDLKPRCQFLSNSYSRKDEVNEFLGNIDTSFKRILDSPVGLEHSSVFVPLASELTRIAQSNAIRKIVIIYSDLMENSSLLSLYKPEHLKFMMEKPDSVKQILQNDIHLPDLRGIEVYFIYQPRNSAESGLFRKVSGFYRDWFESKGAKVTIGANLSM